MGVIITVNCRSPIIYYFVKVEIFNKKSYVFLNLTKNASNETLKFLSHSEVIPFITKSILSILQDYRLIKRKSEQIQTICNLKLWYFNKTVLLYSSF